MTNSPSACEARTTLLHRLTALKYRAWTYRGTYKQKREKMRRSFYKFVCKEELYEKLVLVDRWSNGKPIYKRCGGGGYCTSNGMPWAHGYPLFDWHRSSAMQSWEIKFKEHVWAWERELKPAKREWEEELRRRADLLDREFDVLAAQPFFELLSGREQLCKMS